MKNRDTSSHAQGPLESEKKLRKRERHLNEQLLDALAAQEKARERLQRAEARLRKRTARVQRLEERLAVLHQQLADYTTSPQSENVGTDLSLPPYEATSPIDVGTDLSLPPYEATSPIDVGTDLSLPPYEATSPIDVGTDLSRPAELNGASLPTQTPPAIVHETFVITECGFAELPTDVNAHAEQEQIAAELPTMPSTVIEHQEEATHATIAAPLATEKKDIEDNHEDDEDDEDDEEIKDIPVPDEDEDGEEIEDFVVTEDEEDEDDEDDYDDYDDYDAAEAEEEELEFRRRVAPNRVVTRSVQPPATLQIVTEEQELDSALPQNEQAMSEKPARDIVVSESEQPITDEPALADLVSQDEPSVTEEPVPHSVILQSEQITTEEPVPNRPVAILASAEALAYAREARVVAQATEDAARLAFARAAEVAERLELIGGGRHLMQELTQLETEAEQMQSVARENARIAEIAEQQIDPVELARLHAETSTLDDELDELEDEETEETNETPPVLIADFEAPPPLLIADYEQVSLASPDLYPSKPAEQASLLFAPSEIEDEEEMVEAVTSMLIADAAAATAAKAEALAEASSARTREARRLAVQADRTLQQLRITIAQGILLGDEAERTLRTAEREATYAHAALADAEAAEEYARRDAINAEAEAEVAEGMAMAADAHARDNEQSRFRNPYTVTADIDTPYDLLDDDDSDDTLEHPAIRPLRPRESA